MAAFDALGWECTGCSQRTRVSMPWWVWAVLAARGRLAQYYTSSFNVVADQCMFSLMCCSFHVSVFVLIRVLKENCWLLILCIKRPFCLEVTLKQINDSSKSLRACWVASTHSLLKHRSQKPEKRWGIWVMHLIFDTMDAQTLASHILIYSVNDTTNSFNSL